MSLDLFGCRSVYALHRPTPMNKLAWILMVAGCAGTIDGGPSSTPPDVDASVTPPGSDAPTTPSGAKLQLGVTTTPNGGPYAPRNIVAVWVEAAGGAFVKTIDRWAATRKSHLVAWNQAAGTNDVDAVSGATRQNHNTPLSITWDLKDRNGNVVPDGTYTIRMELADSNASQTTQNHQGTFTFTKGAAADNQTGLSNGGFQNVSIDFTP